MNIKWIYFLGFFLLAVSCQQNGVDLIISNTNIVDVESGEILTAQDIVIRDGTILEIIPGGSDIHQASEIIDGSDQYVIPGLWDMHVHNWWAYEDFSPLLMAYGVTGVREMWGNTEVVNKIRQLIATDGVLGPDIISAGAIVDGKPPAWDGSDVADTPEAGREIVRRQKAEGVDFIKVYSLLQREVYFAIADECKKQNVPFSGHIPERVTLQEALEAGHGSIEHFYGIPDYCSSEYGYLEKIMKGEIENDTLVDLESWYNRMDFVFETYDSNRIQSLVELIAIHQPWICPTLVVHLGAQRNYDPDYPYDRRIDYLPDFTIDSWRIDASDKEDSLSRITLQTELNSYKILGKLMKPLKDHGARFLAGSDYPNPYTFPGFSIHEELELFVRDAGFTPLEALQTATINPALFLGLDNEVGTISSGKKANILLLANNPLDDITNTTKINGVILRGNYHQASTLREKIEAIAAYHRRPKIREVLLPVILNQGIEAGIDQYYELKAEKVDSFNFDEEQLNTLGYELLQRNRNDEAVKIFELNIKIYPQYANGHDSLGDSYMAVGDTAQAKIVWQRAVDLGMNATKDKLASLID